MVKERAVNCASSRPEKVAFSPFTQRHACDCSRRPKILRPNQTRVDGDLCGLSALDTEPKIRPRPFCPEEEDSI